MQFQIILIISIHSESSIVKVSVTVHDWLLGPNEVWERGSRGFGFENEGSPRGRYSREGDALRTGNYRYAACAVIDSEGHGEARPVMYLRGQFGDVRLQRVADDGGDACAGGGAWRALQSLPMLCGPTGVGQATAKESCTPPRAVACSAMHVGQYEPAHLPHVA